MCMLSPIFVLSTGYNVHCLADIIKKYNPDVKGFSLGKGDVNSDNAHLNVANPGDQARSAGGYLSWTVYCYQAIWAAIFMSEIQITDLLM